MIACGGAATVAARRLGDALLAGCPPATMRLGRVVLAVSVLLCALELTGILGVLSAVGVVGAMAAICGVVLACVTPGTPADTTGQPVRTSTRGPGG